MFKYYEECKDGTEQNTEVICGTNWCVEHFTNISEHQSGSGIQSKEMNCIHGQINFRSTIRAQSCFGSITFNLVN